MGSAVPKPHL
uniref:Uncharacterized protein n=1 Tax=Arundo donax TaxID=35708 RepID=A0A0A9R721_ARUDO